MGLLPGEFSILGRVFDEMLSNLSQREVERDKALDALKSKIAQHKETESALREREGRLRILFEQTADAIYVSKPDGCLIRVNQQACRATGYTGLHFFRQSTDKGVNKMIDGNPFGEVLEAADRLTLEEQEELMDVLSRRIAERRRDQLARDVRSARSELRKKHCRPPTPDELMTEILS
jgi:PAS domain-containing protein